jgi:hypothetical protein
MVELHEKCERDIHLEAQRLSAAQRSRERDLLQARRQVFCDGPFSRVVSDVKSKEEIRIARKESAASSERREWPVKDSRDKVIMSMSPQYDDMWDMPMPYHMKYRNRLLPFTVRKQKKDERRWMQIGRDSLANGGPQTASSVAQVNSNQRWRPSKGQVDWEWSWEVREPDVALEYLEADFEKMNEDIPPERKEIRLEDIMKPGMPP